MYGNEYNISVYWAEKMPAVMLCMRGIGTVDRVMNSVISEVGTLAIERQGCLRIRGYKVGVAWIWHPYVSII